MNPKGVHQRMDVVFVTKQTTDGCDAKSYKDIHVDLKIPQLSPTDLKSSKIIKVKYLLRVSGIAYFAFVFLSDCTWYLLFLPHNLHIGNGVGWWMAWKPNTWTTYNNWHSCHSISTIASTGNKRNHHQMLIKTNKKPPVCDYCALFFVTSHLKWHIDAVWWRHLDA